VSTVVFTLSVNFAGERKHWQKKAQSLSKDMQKMLNVGADVAQLKEENARLVFRIEVSGPSSDS